MTITRGSQCSVTVKEPHLLIFQLRCRSAYVGSIQVTAIIKYHPSCIYLRFKSNCTKEENFLVRSRKQCKNLMGWGYSKKKPKKPSRKLFKGQRIKPGNLLYMKKDEDLFLLTRILHIILNTVTFSGIYDPRHWHLLRDDPLVAKYIGRRPEITFRQARPI